MTTKHVQLPPGLAVGVVQLQRFRLNPRPWLERVLRTNEHVVILSGHVGHVRAVAYLSPEPPTSLAGLVPALVTEAQAFQHDRASERAASRTGHIKTMVAAQGRNRKAAS